MVRGVGGVWVGVWVYTYGVEHWCGAVWCGVVWYGVVGYGMVFIGL